MVKKYSPTLDSNNKPAMKLDDNGHFVHINDFQEAVDAIETVLGKLKGLDRSVFAQFQTAITASLDKAYSKIKL